MFNKYNSDKVLDDKKHTYPVFDVCDELTFRISTNFTKDLILNVLHDRRVGFYFRFCILIL